MQRPRCSQAVLGVILLGGRICCTYFCICEPSQTLNMVGASHMFIEAKELLFSSSSLRSVCQDHNNSPFSGNSEMLLAISSLNSHTHPSHSWLTKFEYLARAEPNTHPWDLELRPWGTEGQPLWLNPEQIKIQEQYRLSCGLKIVKSYTSKIKCWIDCVEKDRIQREVPGGF